MTSDHQKTKGTRYGTIYTVFTFILTLVVAIFSFLILGNYLCHNGINTLLLDRLVSIGHLPDDFKEMHSQSKKIIYVLGGSQKSLYHRFKTAARVYQESDAQKILILSRRGITEYDPLLGRNLTNDEWAIKKLKELGVQKRNIEPLFINYGLFGTLAEAKGVSQEVINKGYDVIILVSSPYHTARVRECFSKYLKDKDITIFVYGSDDYLPLWGLLIEYFKLLLYKTILL